MSDNATRVTIKEHTLTEFAEVLWKRREGAGNRTLDASKDDMSSVTCFRNKAITLKKKKKSNARVGFMIE